MALHRREARHARRLQEMAQLMHQIDHTTGLLSPSDQAARRQTERLIRKSAVAFARWASELGMVRHRIADLLGLRTGTLTRWLASWGRSRLPLRPRGRPRRLATSDERALTIELLDHAGPGIGLPGLCAAFPHITRTQLIEIRTGVREQRAMDNTREYQVLQWPVSGTVWAFDYTQPPVPVEERFRQVLAGRDLASGFQLLALPVLAATADMVVDALDTLFHQVGPPLVFKSDNGSQFLGEQTTQLLEHWQVTALPSPPRTPQYNGSIEAGIGSLKTHAYHRAVHHGRPHIWTTDDLEAARMDANFTSRPWGSAGPSPQHRWDARKPITRRQRIEFMDAVKNETQQARVDMGLPTTGTLGRVAQAAVGRAAVRRALETLGYLLVTRRRLSPSIII